MDFMLGILGIIGGVLCGIGDILLDFKGPGNVKFGPSKILDSNWKFMSEWRFRASIYLAAIGVPLYLFGFLGMRNQLAQNNETVAVFFLVFSFFGASGGLFIHALTCLVPIIHKTLTQSGVSDDKIETVCAKIISATKLLIFIIFFSLVIASSITLIYAILGGFLDVPFVFIILNPLGLMLIGWLFRLISKRYFSDLPGIAMPSLGIAMIGLMTVISAAI